MSRLKGLNPTKKRLLGLFISITIIAIGLIPHVILVFSSRVNHSYTIEPLSLESNDGTHISAWQYTPEMGRNHVGIVMGHYFSGSKHHMHPISSELVKRGFTVINIDFRGHGSSEGHLGRKFMDDMKAAVDFFEYNISYITEIGLVGHSYGGRMALKLSRLYPNRINATVTIGNLPTNFTGISNLLMAVGIVEPFITTEALYGVLKAYTGQEDVEIGVRYGDWNSGNNTMAFLSSNTEHFFEVMNPSIIYQIIRWFEQAFKTEQANKITITAPIFQIYSYLSLIGVFMLTFMLTVYLSNFLFKRKKIDAERIILKELDEFSIRNLINYYTIYVVIIGVIFFIFLWEGLMYDLIPLSTANLILILMIGNTIGTVFLYYFMIIHKKKFSLKDLFLKIKDACVTNPGISTIYGILTAIFFILSLSLTWHWSVNNVIPTPIEIGIMMFLIIFSFPFILVKEFYFRNVQCRMKLSSRSKEYFKMVFIGIIMDNFLLGVIKFFSWINQIYVPDSLRYVFAWIIFSIIQNFITTWVYMWSGRNILGSTVFLSIFYAWMTIIFLPSFGFL